MLSPGRILAAFRPAFPAAGSFSPEREDWPGTAQLAGAPLVAVGIAGRDLAPRDRCFPRHRFLGSVFAGPAQRHDLARSFAVDGSILASRFGPCSQTYA